ncbi:MAG TPA: L-histidine N(alpha)-methyltransferase [Candidatus Dormibacteraeota bacterium]|nr:L-histidine N(alpha)-methyltransferase [Candidatus Dormibacteraeota bacterium]
MISTQRWRVVRLESGGGTFADDVRAGLLSTPRRLPAKYLYDALGSTLFEAITELPEYYLTRAEREIIERESDALISAAGLPDEIVELGGGSGAKTRAIIEAALRARGNVQLHAVDIAEGALVAACRSMVASYPDLTITGYAGDYDAGLAAIKLSGSRALALFLGSNIGNLDSDEAHVLLRRLRAALRPGDALLLGTDLRKDPALLEAAYDDALGVTAAFERNVLVRINRELGADFDVARFRHVAAYDVGRGCVSSHLVCIRSQEVRIRALGLTVRILAGERIHTEDSYKYSEGQIDEMAAAGGFARERTWHDEGRLFALSLLRAV